MSVLESTTEATIFWLAMIIADIVWVTFLLISMLTFSFKWMVSFFLLFLQDKIDINFEKDNYYSRYNFECFKYLWVFEV